MNGTRKGFFDVPPLRYAGAKWQLAEWIIAQMPPHEVYVEPFAGSAAVFMRKWPSKLEVLNDMDETLVNFFDVLRDRPQELIRAINLTPWSRREYERSYEPCEDPLERARRFYIACNQSFGSTLIYKSGWRFRRTIKSRSALTKTWARLDGLYDAAYRLKDAQIECRPALEVIERFDSRDTLFYVDPPYVLDSRAGKRRYRFEMTKTEHIELAECLETIEGMAIVSGYPSELYDKALYPDWTRLEMTTTTNGNGTALEVLWLSPNLTAMNALPLFQAERD